MAQSFSSCVGSLPKSRLVSVRSKFAVLCTALPLSAIGASRVSVSAVAPALLFTLVILSAILCIIAAASLLVLTHRNGRAELGFVGAFFVAVSVLPLVHGLTVPGILYGPNAATTTATMTHCETALFRSRRILSSVVRRPVVPVSFDRWRADAITDAGKPSPTNRANR